MQDLSHTKVCAPALQSCCFPWQEAGPWLRGCVLGCHEAVALLVAPGEVWQRDPGAFLTLEGFSCGLNETSGGN